MAKAERIEKMSNVRAKLQWDRGHYPRPTWVGYAIIEHDPQNQYGTEIGNSIVPLDYDVNPGDWGNDEVMGIIKSRGCINFRFLPLERIGRANERS